jgi:hypothetical protein
MDAHGAKVLWSAENRFQPENLRDSTSMYGQSSVAFCSQEGDFVVGFFD